jgi:hypothetical protein
VNQKPLPTSPAEQIPSGEVIHLRRDFSGFHGRLQALVALVYLLVGFGHGAGEKRWSAQTPLCSMKCFFEQTIETEIKH